MIYKYKYYINTQSIYQFINYNCSGVYTFLKNYDFFQKSHFFKNHTSSKITLFQKSHFFKNHTFWTNPGFSKITLFFKLHLFVKNHAFCTLLQNSVLFQNFRVCKNSPFKVHFGIPRLTTCKKAVFPYKISVFDYEI